MCHRSVRMKVDVRDGKRNASGGGSGIGMPLRSRKMTASEGAF